MILKLSWNKIIDLLLNASENLVLIMPSIQEEWVEVIKKNEYLKEKLRILVCIDNSEKVIRDGYGGVQSIEELKKLGANIKECDGLRIGFLASDSEIYCIFMESRIIAGDPEGYNALKLNLETGRGIMLHFFPELIYVEQENPIEVIATTLQTEKVEKIKEALIKYPVENPDLKRKINTYRTHFQYADIHFEGGGVQSKTITIPKDALPFKDANLKDRMKTRFNLFTKEDTDKWNKLDEIDTMIKAVRKEFLTTCKYKRGRNIIDKSKKEAFLKKVEEIKKAVEEKKKDLTDDIQRAINKSEDVLTKELTDFFETNPPEKIKDIKDAVLRKRQIEKIIQEILLKTKIPSATDLIDKMVIETEYAEFTEEDLNDEEFLKWFKEKKLLTKETENEIASFKNAFEVKL